MSFTETLQSITGKLLADCTDQELYLALLELVRQKSADRVQPVTGRKLYYISAEFLIGKLLSNNLINLGLYEEARDALAAAGKRLSDIEEVEPEPSLGNGGLGRLAACFLDSLATLNLPGDGVGLRYHFGLFHQSFEDGVQNEKPDPWLTAHSWAEKTDTTYPVELAGKEYTARLYKLAVTGYEGRTNTLNLFDLDTIDESIVHDGIQFDKTAIAKNLTLFLYPDDSDEAGRMLRIYQQYLMVSAGAQLILAECAARGCNYHDLADYAAIQINDTHPSMVIPELIRLLGEKGIEFDEAVKIVTDTCAYTNHTILPEALEKWPIGTFSKLLPRVYQIIDEISRRWHESFDTTQEGWQERLRQTAILWDGEIRMANLSVICSHSVNGVAKIHSDIIKNIVLKDFYALTPEKFNNKTNGISHRRFFAEANPTYAKLVTEAIGDGWLKDAFELEKLKEFKDDTEFLKAVGASKRANKERLAAYVKAETGLVIDPNTVFDVQVKRFHAYKRQLMNIMKVMDIYNRRIADPNFHVTPTTFIFSGKAASSYTFAKETIRLINSVAEVINNDARVNEVMKVCFIPNFRVSNAQLIYPAAEISEQISTAGKEASGTSNMKLMMNGAITLGTLDGANIEIADLAGRENEAIFGLTAPEVEQLWASNSYFAWDTLNGDRERLGRVMDELKDNTFAGLSGNFESIYNELMNNNDPDLVMADFRSYVDAWEKLTGSYGDQETWNRKALLNTASSGWFSSDRTIREYRDEIWHA